MSLALEGLEKEGLVSFDDSSLMFGPMFGGLTQKKVALQDGGFLVDGAALGRLAHADALDKRLTAIAHWSGLHKCAKGVPLKALNVLPQASPR